MDQGRLERGAVVMAGLDPATHAGGSSCSRSWLGALGVGLDETLEVLSCGAAWMAGSSPAKTNRAVRDWKEAP